MNSEKADWLAKVKASSAPRGVFSEMMKQTVLDRVEKSRRKRRNKPFLYAAALLLGIMIGISAIPFLGGLPAALTAGKAADKHAAMGAATSGGQDIVLQYEPAKESSSIPESDKGLRHSSLMRVPLATVEIKETAALVGGGKYVGYTIPGLEPTLFFGFQLASDVSSASGQLYEIGIGSMSEVQLQPSDAFGVADFRLDGQCGPQRRCAFWISIDGGKVAAYYQLDAAAIHEQDLDGDGVTEAIVLTDAQDLYIYNNIAGQIESVHVQAALKADYDDIVTYDPVNQQFTLSHGDETKRYRYVQDGTDRLRQVRE